MRRLPSPGAGRAAAPAEAGDRSRRPRGGAGDPGRPPRRRPTPLGRPTIAVRTFGRNGDRRTSRTSCAVVPKAPPAAPEQVTVTPRGDGIQVEWTPAAGTVAGYNVYRRGAQERSNGKPVHTAGAAGEELARQHGPVRPELHLQRDGPLPAPAADRERASRASTRSTTSTASRRRRRPSWWRWPRRAGSAWSGGASEAEDVAGYIVYRRVGDSGKFERVTPKPVEAAEYVDTAVGSGKTYTYRVTAVDQAGNESAPGRRGPGRGAMTPSMMPLLQGLRQRQRLPGAGGALAGPDPRRRSAPGAGAASRSGPTACSSSGGPAAVPAQGPRWTTSTPTASPPISASTAPAAPPSSPSISAGRRGRSRCARPRASSPPAGWTTPASRSSSRSRPRSRAS